jgi:5-methyltetrahydropteroyltriglutamate--homocysteine methyltransferase
VQRSRDRFLTTHTGSLPRPDDLIRMMYAKEEGVPVDASALAARVRTAVMEVVRKQADAGVDLINDGEMSKPSYATYIKDRLNGFGGTGNTFVYQDLSDFPRLEKRVFGDPGRSRRKTPACNAEISVRDKEAPQTDADNLNAKLALMGMEANVGPANVAGKGVWYRVRLGPYTRVDEINRIRQQLTQNGVEVSLVKVTDTASN